MNYEVGSVGIWINRDRPATLSGTDVSGALQLRISKDDWRVYNMKAMGKKRYVSRRAAAVILAAVTAFSSAGADAVSVYAAESESGEAVMTELPADTDSTDTGAVIIYTAGSDEADDDPVDIVGSNYADRETSRVNADSASEDTEIDDESDSEITEASDVIAESDTEKIVIIEDTDSEEKESEETDSGSEQSADQVSETYADVQTGDAVSFVTSGDSTSYTVSGDSAGMSVSVDKSGATSVSITEAGTYTLSGNAINTYVTVAEGLTDGVILKLDDLTIDDSGLAELTGKDIPVIAVKKSGITFELTGSSYLWGSSIFVSEPEAVIKAPSSKISFAGDGILNVEDKMDPDTSFVNSEGTEVDPADAISAKKGEITFTSGTVNVTKSCGSAVKAKDGTINVKGGTLSTSYTYDDAVKAKDGTINILSGTVNISYSYGDGLKAKKEDSADGGNINISGGTVNITEEIYGDGIQGENVNISDGEVNITTVYNNAATQYYTNGSNVSGKNTITETNDTYKTERINVNTGDHAGIKAGTKESTRIYSDLQTSDPGNAVVTYEASGGLNISGGNITINTLGAGLKANKASGYTACSNGQYIIGSPDDGLHSNNDLFISGGNIIINSSDDGITSAGKLYITGSDTVVDIQNSFEGMEGSEIVFGTSGSENGPTVMIVSDDDGINAAHKSGTTYTYDSSEDEDCNYTKTTVKAEGNSCTVYSGTVKVMIDSSSEKTRELRNGSASSTKTVSYTADGDGIDCNGTLDLEGGTTIVFGTSPSTSNSPLDTDSGFTLGSNAILLATGADSMNESTPEYGNGKYIVYGSSSGNGNTGGPGFGGMGGFAGMGGPGNSSGSSASISAGSSFKVVAGTTTLIDTTLPYAASFLIYADPNLAGSNTVTIGSTSTTLSASSVSGTNTGTAISGVSVSPSSKTLTIGGNTILTATVSTTSSGSSGQFGPGSNNGQQGGPGNSNSVIWTTSDSSVASVAASSVTTAKVYGLKAGTATITATSAADSSKYATCTITVSSQLITSITLDSSSLKLAKGDTHTLNATVSPSYASDPTLTWTSSDENVATVTDGTVTAVGKGNATITAAATDGSNISASCIVYVTESSSADEGDGGSEPGSGEGGSDTDKETDESSGQDSLVNPSATDSENIYSAEMVKGQTTILGAGSWTSSDPNVARVVKKTGKVTARGTGTAVITNSAADKTTSIKIAVYSPALSINKLSLVVGGTEQLAISNTGSMPISWISSNNSVVSVTGDQYGQSNEGDKATTALAELTAVGKGTAKVTAYVGGKAYTATVTVKDVTSTVALAENAEVSLNVFQTYTPKFSNGFVTKGASWTYADGAALEKDGNTWIAGEGSETWLTINNSGKISALKSGDYQLTGTDVNGKSVNIKLSVSAIPTKTDIYLNVGQKVTYKNTYVKGQGISWTVGSAQTASLKNETKASVTVTGVAAGETELKCSYQGETYVTTVHVEDPSLEMNTVSSAAGAQLVKSSANAYNYTLTLKKGETFRLKQEGVDQAVNWKSSSNAKAFVSEYGVIYARAKGSATISAKINNKTVKIKVTVTE
ncbi:MAG: carbohydrate-binding domain-containing protein [Lachnospiraceae bacterium]|nr:carbohydrate-binding domain-containing protein [Lachnospiraceae bacterium]